MYTVDYAHNDYLQVLAELGVFGFAAGLIFVGRLVQRTARGTFYARSVDERYLSIACLAAMTAILLHSVVDFNMYVPANGFAFAWIAGAAGAQLRARAPERAAPEKPAA
jgi:O-antigen ligase